MKLFFYSLVFLLISISTRADPIWNPSNSYALASSLLFTTARIECSTSNGEIRVGTGAYVFFAQTNNLSAPTLVTCKHVIEGATEGHITVTVQSITNEYDEQRLNLRVPNFDSRWVRHPQQEIDLVALPLAGLMNELAAKGQKIKMLPIGSHICPTPERMEDLGPLMPLAMVGYPIGLWDQKNNLPILRRGVAATDPTEDYNGKREFLIDSACFPGSSGSPVFIYEEGFIYERRQAKYGHRLTFLGILYGGPEYTKEGKLIVKNIPTRLEPRSETTIPVNLGYITRYDVVMEFNDYFLKAILEAGRRD